MIPLNRIIWKHRNSGAIPIEGASKASNHGIITDTFYVDDLNDTFPELEFIQQTYIEPGGWVNSYAD